MNKFRTEPIKKQIENKEKSFVKSHIFLTIIGIIVGFLLLKGVVLALTSGGGFSVKNVVFSALGNQLDTDEHGNTNILLLGVGGEGHDGEDLTDTMIVASIDHDENLISMLSIPRDLYVESEYVGYGTRINGVYQLVADKTGSKEIGIRALKSEFQNMFGIKINYYAKIDFKGFTEIVDAIGGVTVNVKENIYDTTYPAPDGSSKIYEPFYLKAGEQTLNGETALKYARSRHTSNDFDRARRQQEIIQALKDKALSSGVLLNPAKIRGVYNAVANNFETDLGISQILYLAKISKNYEGSQIQNQIINDAAVFTAGFLYTPPKEEYGGALVLVPYSGDYEELKTFANLFLFEPGIFMNPIPIEVYNSTKQGGLAAEVKMYMNRYGFEITRFGNAELIGAPTTTVYYRGENADEAEKTIDALKNLFPYSRGEDQAATGTGAIVIELGEDFKDFYRENANKFYIGY